jgi:putative ABC transport system permease protein
VIQLARRLTPAGLPYLWRQGLANLHRPANQTVTVVLALGFGAFLLTTLFTIEHNLLRDLRIDDAEGKRPNLVLFDIQPTQRALVDSALQAEGQTPGPFTPIVPMRILSVNGRPVRGILSGGRDSTADSTTDDSPQRGREGRGMWAFRREYRSTYRTTLNAGETVTAGRWFTTSDTASGRTAADPVAISVEADLAGQLGVALGDRITWDIQGVPVYSRIVSLRQVNWARFEPNFFVIFAPGALEQAPQTAVTLARIVDPLQRGRVQRRLAQRAANITTVDLGDVQRAIETVVGRIIFAIRFMAIFSLVTGAIVLIGAITTSRWQRVREGTLLRTLGATRAQVMGILSVEYAALGLSAALVASLLAGVAGWALAKWVFDATFDPPILAMLGLAAALIAFTMVVGLLSSREVLRRPPLEVLRAE